MNGKAALVILPVTDYKGGIEGRMFTTAPVPEASKQTHDALEKLSSMLMVGYVIECCSTVQWGQGEALAVVLSRD